MLYNGEECYGVIYRIHHRESGKCYIGQTVDIERRFRGYRAGRARHQLKLDRALLKYGVSAFDFEVIYLAYDKQQLDWLEIWFIEGFHAISSGYNCRGGGANGLHSDETRRRMSQAKMGHTTSAETRAKMSRPRSRTWTLSPEVRARMSVAKKSRKRPNSHCSKARPARRPRRQVVVCTTTGITYPSINEAGAATSTNPVNISNCCRGRYKSAGKLNGAKLVWRYANQLPPVELPKETP